MRFSKYKRVSAVLTVLGFTITPFNMVHAGGGLNLFSLGNSVENPWYLGAAIGASKLEPRLLGGGGSVIDDSSEGFQVYGGYKFNHRLSLEAFYSDLGKARVDVVTDTSDVDYSVYGVGLVGSHPLNNKINIFGKLGYGELDNKVNSDLAFSQVEDNTIYTGIGIEYELAEAVSLRMAYDYYDEDYQFLSLGFQFNF